MKQSLQLEMLALVPQRRNSRPYSSKLALSSLSGNLAVSPYTVYITFCGEIHQAVLA